MRVQIRLFILPPGFRVFLFALFAIFAVNMFLFDGTAALRRDELCPVWDLVTPAVRFRAVRRASLLGRSV